MIRKRLRRLLGHRENAVAGLAACLMAAASSAASPTYGAELDSVVRGTVFDPAAAGDCDNEADGPADDAAADEKCCYGPCGCHPRKTLLQWSYGTSFSGGPDLDEPLVTDRPDFTEASTPVGRGVAQLELGWTYTYDNDGIDNVKSHSYPETLLRYGALAEWLELRAAWNFANEEAAGIHSRGSEHLYLGMKLGLTPQEGILPEMAIMPQMNVPTGSRVLAGSDVQPGVNWLYGWDVTESISTAGSTQFNRALDDASGNAYTEWAQSWTIGYSLAERVGAYTEWFAFFPHGADAARPEHYFNGGFSFYLSNDVVWDVRAGVGLNDAADDYFVGTGMALRFR